MARNGLPADAEAKRRLEAQPAPPRLCRRINIQIGAEARRAIRSRGPYAFSRKMNEGCEQFRRGRGERRRSRVVAPIRARRNRDCNFQIARSNCERFLDGGGRASPEGERERGNVYGWGAGEAGEEPRRTIAFNSPRRRSRGAQRRPS